VKSLEAFGLVSSRHAESFGGLLDIKFEDADDINWDIPVEGHLDANEYLESLKIDPKLRFIPEVTLASRIENVVIGVSGKSPTSSGLVVGDVEAMDVDEERVGNSLVVAAHNAQVSVSGGPAAFSLGDQLQDSPLSRSSGTRRNAKDRKAGPRSTIR
jgi:hypothetical protein